MKKNSIQNQLQDEKLGHWPRTVPSGAAPEWWGQRKYDALAGDGGTTIVDVAEGLEQKHREPPLDDPHDSCPNCQH